MTEVTEKELMKKFIKDFERGCSVAKRSTSRFTYHCRTHKDGNEYSVCHNFQDEGNKDGIILPNSYYDIFDFMKEKPVYQGLKLHYARGSNQPEL